MKPLQRCGSLFSLLIAASLAYGATPQIKDEAGFFSAEAVKKANEEIQEIARLYKKEVLIETFKTVPDGKAERVRQMSREARSQFFDDWLRERVSQARTDGARVDGVYILMCKDPSHFKMSVTRGTATRAFTTSNRNQLSKMMAENFKKETFDEVLLEAVAYIKKTMGENLAEK